MIPHYFENIITLFLIFFLIYVDDILLISPDSKSIIVIISLLKKVFTMKDLGSANFFLGIELLKTTTGYFLSQSQYALSILKKLEMENTKPVSNPCSFSETTNSHCSVDPTLYLSTVGALQYLTITRPNISFDVNRACQTMYDPSPLDWQRVKHLLCYLKGTISDSLFYSSQSNLSLEVFSDADWASSPLDQRSTGAYLVFLGRNLISWSSRKQRTVARSSTEAEYKAVADATAELIWIKYLLRELQFRLSTTPVLWCDNVGATFWHPTQFFMHGRSTSKLITILFASKSIHRSFVLGTCQQRIKL